MRQTSGMCQSHGEKVIKDIRRATRKQYSAEEKIRIAGSSRVTYTAGPAGLSDISKNR